MVATLLIPETLAAMLVNGCTAKGRSSLVTLTSKKLIVVESFAVASARRARMKSKMKLMLAIDERGDNRGPGVGGRREEDSP